MIRILIVDDQILLRESLKSIIECDNEIDVIGCAENGFEALRMCDELLPDLVLMDIKMPLCDGVEGTKLIKARHNTIKVLILTTFDDDENVTRALKNGADGYILKDVTPEELILIIKNAVKGFYILSNKTYGTVAKRLDEDRTVHKDFQPDKLGDKSERGMVLKDAELKILRLIAEGKSNREIASVVYLSEGRVKNIISEMFTKLKLRDRYQLISYAYKNNLIE
ncbi:LuxR family transcriptional regulator [Clostridiales bacterium PH28_bin88]|nr:LuxR family transcriptional regulator [Clostridiales bacterium PH28_bin88]